MSPGLKIIHAGAFQVKTTISKITLYSLSFSVKMLENINLLNIRWKIFMKSFLRNFTGCIAGIFLLIPVFLSCDSGLKGQLEYADFLLDEGKFSDAITLLTILDDKYPDNRDVKSKLGSAHLAHALLDEGATYLSLVADYFEETTEGNEFKQFSDKSPNLTQVEIVELGLARKILSEQIPDDQKREGEWLQLGFARLMEINAIGVVKTGALSEDKVCNAAPDDPSFSADGIPDDYDSDALTQKESEQFNENAQRAGNDFENAGLSRDMGIIKTVERIAQGISNFGSVQAYLDDQYGVGTPCPPATP